MARTVYTEELNRLALEVSKMGGQLEHMLDEVSRALKDMDSELAKKIMKEDDIVDDMERRIEKACIHLIAKQQPVATDLRRITSVMRLISDIERVADHCSDISENILEINEDTPVKAPRLLFVMLEEVKKMAVDTIDSFVEENLEKCQWVSSNDDKIDDYFLRIKEELCSFIQEDIAHVKTYVDYLMIAKYMERMADHCTNIAEWVSFIITGDLDQYMNS